jgi:DNA-binding response OmpR family regulator
MGASVEGEDSCVLVVDDEPDIVKLNRLRLEDEYAVRTAEGGDAALDRLDETVDVVLLDRRMPEMSGDELLDEIRDRGYDCRVAMVTAVEPDLDLVEMPFDEYLVKPVSNEEIHEAVEALLRRETYDEAVQQYFSLATKRAALEVAKPDDELNDDSRFDELDERARRVRAEAEDALSGMSDREYDRLFAAV